MRGIVLSLAFALPAVAAEPVKPELKADPAVLAKLAALKPNQGVTLGKAAVVGDFNDTAKKYDLHKTGPRGRDYSIKMCWAPDRERALFCGANHAVPHRLNDVWEFDLGALTWAMLYAPDLPRDYTGIGKDFSDVEFNDGVLMTKRGGPAIIAHTWWGLTYDTSRKQLLFMNTWVTEKKKAVESLKGDPAELYTGPPLWAFDPAAAKWTALKQEKPYPTAIFGGMLEYIPEMGGTVWHTNNWQMRGTWRYDAAKNAWTDVKANGGGKTFEAEAAEPEQIGYHDPVRKLLVVHRHKATHHFDTMKRVWKKTVAADKDDETVPYGHDAFGTFFRDPVSGKGILLDYKANALWSYDPVAAKWTRLKPDGDPMPTGGKRLAYLDPKHNAFVVHDGVTVWAYRFAAKK